MRPQLNCCNSSRLQHFSHIASQAMCDRMRAALTAHAIEARKEKAAMPEDLVRQCGLFFSRVNA
jgi:hypothetical protein